MLSRSRSLSLLTLLVVGSTLLVGPLGCASTKSRTKWWQFWRSKKADIASATPVDWDRKFIPPPDVLEPDYTLGETASLAGEESLPEPSVAMADLMDLPATESPRQEPRGMVSGLITVHFAYNSYELDEVARTQLNQNLDWILQHPGIEMQIQGHCDERGTLEYNLLLGERRAKAVKADLVQSGVPPEILHTISFGEERPLDWGSDLVAYAKNRRAQFWVY